MTGTKGIVALAVVVTALAACGKPYRIIRQAVPNPLLGKRDFKVAPLSFQGLTVGAKSEANYLAGKSPEQRQSFEADKQAVANNFFSQLKGRAGGFTIVPAGGPGGHTINPRVNMIEPGIYTYIVNIPSTVDMSLTITDAQNVVVDEINIRVSVAATITNPSSGGRLRTCGHRIGDVMAMYLSDRTTPQ